MFSAVRIGGGRRAKYVAPAGVADPYDWYPALDLNDVPFHTAAGSWGAQQTVQAVVEPTITRSVTVTTEADLASALAITGSRVYADFSTTNDLALTGSKTDVELIIPSGRSFRGIVIGSFAQAATLTRVRVRGGTLGQFSGGTIGGNLTFLANTHTDIHVDGVQFASLNADSAGVVTSFYDTSSPLATRFAITNTRSHCEEAAHYVYANHFVFAGNTTFTGRNPDVSNASSEAWCIRGRGSPVLIYDNYLRGQKFHRARVAPTVTFDDPQYSWVSGNTFVDLRQARIWNATANADDNAPVTPGANRYTDATWFVDNAVYAEASDGSGLAPNIEGDNVATYLRFTGNSFYGDFAQSTLNTASSASAATDKDVSTGNSFNAIQAPPAWNRAGDPTGVDLPYMSANAIVDAAPFLTPDPLGSLSFTASWSADASADGFVIYVSTKSRASATLDLYPWRYLAAAGTTSLVISNVFSGTKYYRVQPYDAGVLGTVSAESSATPA